jgi:hypothetical protein
MPDRKEISLKTMMVNGKRLGDCTGDEVGEIGEWYQQLGKAAERLSGRSR